MKIKTWLLISYLVVMLLPLIAAYMLFVWINAYYAEEGFGEQMDAYIELSPIQTILEEPALYRVDSDFSKVEEMGSERISITLYNQLGFILYSTNPMKKQTFLSFTPKKQLYEGFYERQQKFETIRYKEPVFSGSSIVGVYEIEWARDEWVAGVGKRTWMTITLFTLFFATLFIVIVYLVNRKFNKPLQQLMKQMNSFAKGLPIGEVRKSNDELGELSKSFEMMHENLVEANEKLADEQQQKAFMIASISHDLKTPLTSIRAYAEALESDKLSTAQKNVYRKVIVEKSIFMRKMLDDLLMYTLLQSSSYTMESVIVDGEEFFDMLVSDYDTLCQEKGIQLREIVDVAGLYEVNAQQLIRVVDNLMANAIKHTKPGDKIWLGAVNVEAIPDWCFNFVQQSLPETEGMYLIVQNEGKGISLEQLEKIFDPLYQADEARTKEGSGTGLGLSITKQIIEKHGGKVEMYSKENRGTAVICHLPSSKGEENETMDIS